jgi:hypothetical protein
MRSHDDLRSITKLARVTPRSGAAFAIVAFFLLFLISSAPHRVHHLLENLPPPSSDNSRSGERTVLIVSDDSGAQQSSASTAKPSPHHYAQDHSSHPHHHDKKADHHHSHSHSHAHHSHTHEPAQAETVSAAGPHQPDSEPLHANAPQRDAHHDGTARTDCIVQASAKQAQLAPVESAQIAFLADERALRPAVQLVSFTAFDPSPFSQRAPPRA